MNWIRRLFQKEPARPQTPPPATFPAPPLGDDVLFDRLWAGIVRKNQIPVFVRPQDKMWSKSKDPASYGKDAAGLYVPHLGHIYLSQEFALDPWVLAHELGHWQLHRRGLYPHTEPQADAAARVLLRTVVTQEEWDALASRINIYLPVAP